jgi:predicted dehydrogenase
MSINVGIIGMGYMGRTHYEAYQQLPNVRVRAICDNKLARAQGDMTGTAGNVLKEGIDRISMEGVHGTTSWREVVELPDVDVVDICTRTPGHVELAVTALERGKHVICEKPLARTAAEAEKIVAAAQRSAGIFMPAMCLRFWPEWVWAKEAVADGRFGRVRAATFRRVASMPKGWFSDGAQSGGALVDLHIHDVDFILWLFGRPASVFSRGYSKTSGEIDHVVTQYLFKGEGAPELVTAEGSWCMADGFEFEMSFTINCEAATIDYDFARSAQALKVFRDGRTEVIACKPENGYIGELRYFTDCARRGEKPAVVTGADAVECLKVLEAERESVRSGRTVSLS